VNENELELRRRLLGVNSGVSRSYPERTFRNKNLDLIREKNNAAPSLRRELEAEHEQLRQACASLGESADQSKNRGPVVRKPVPSVSIRQASDHATRTAPIGTDLTKPEPPTRLCFDN
jgi:hypothetical protein